MDEENKKKENYNDDSNIGKPEIKILNLVIDQSYALIEKYDGYKNMNEEKKKLIDVAEKAKIYKDDLQKLLELNFDTPNDDLREFAKKNNLDLNDPNVRDEFFKIRKEYLDKINKFYEDNLLNVNQYNNENNKQKSNAKQQNKAQSALGIKATSLINKELEQEKKKEKSSDKKSNLVQTQEKKITKVPIQQNNQTENLHNIQDNKKRVHKKANIKKKWNLQISPIVAAMIILSGMLIYYLIFD